MGWRSTVRRSVGSRRSTSPTWHSCQTRHRRTWTRSGSPRRSSSTSSCTTRSRRRPTAATRATSPARRRRTSPPPASATRRSSRLRPSSTSSTRCATRRSRTRATTTSTPRPERNTGAETDPDGRPNRGYKVKYKGGYFPVAPVDHFTDLRDDMVRNLAGVGLEIERAHHEVGTAGQAEINYKFNTMLAAADDVMKFKYVVKNTAWAAGKTVTFMPKPIFGDNGSGMHVHQSLWKEGVPLFADEAGYAGLSDMARYYIGGLLHHAPSLLAFTNPTTNSVSYTHLR